MSKTKSEKNIGLLGGTFNPPHLGHVRLGQAVLHSFPLTTINYILSANPPHKSGPQIIDPELRYSLLELALEPFANLSADRAELDRQTPSWTVTTIEQLLFTRRDHSFYFICGSESFLAIQTWYRYQTLLDMIGFLVYLRTPDHQDALTRLCEKEMVFIHPQAPALPAKREITLFAAPTETNTISSTEIRNRIRTGRPFEHLLPESIAKAIKENDLYA